jgi:hypothetical protein
MYDFALLALKLSISPSLFLIGDFTPALLANGEVFTFYLNIELDVFAVADIFPWVLTVFHF